MWVFGHIYFVCERETIYYNFELDAKYAYTK